MYQVFVVEDEPASMEHICMIIQNKCPGFSVIGTAEDGKSALDQLEYLCPDVLITDVRMPVMDGIFLIKRVKERFPDILSVIVSGYQEFEYAQTALRYGVCDYILKPIKPSVLQECMYRMQERLDECYYRLRNRMIREMYRGNISDSRRFRRVFSQEEYYIALLRRNSLPRRFSEFRGVEVFSGREEQLMVYGRDEMEELYICPRELLFQGSFYQMLQHILEKKKKGTSFYTLVWQVKPISVKQLPQKIQELYQTMDHRLIIGKDQMIRIEEERIEKRRRAEDDKENLSRLEHLIREKKYGEIPGEIGACFEKWEKAEYTQLWTEERVREIFHIFRKANLLDDPVEMCEYFLDEAFYYGENMQKLGEHIQQILCKKVEKDSPRTKLDTPEFFEKIQQYMRAHMSEQLSPKQVCSVFGISQAYLSRLFRKYDTVSFSQKMTVFRMEKAQELMKNKKDLFIKDVAAMVGYEDQFYFSRIFRSVIGVSPTEYLKGHDI